jgi:hypothetical protein
MFTASSNVISRSADVSLCERLDAHTLKLGDGSIYKLVGMPDHFTSKLRVKMSLESVLLD